MRCKKIPGYPDYYVDDEGGVYSSKYGYIHKLNPWLSKGYPRVALYVKGDAVGKQIYVSRLVLLAFKGPCPPGMECRHLNGVRTDSRPGNLEWGTSKQNNMDRNTHGTMPIGERHPHSKFTESDVREIRDLYEKDGLTQKEIAKRFGVTTGATYSITKRLTWRHVL